MTVLVATDFSTRSQNATRLATALAQRRGVPLIVVHAIESPVIEVPLLPIGASGVETERLAAAELAIAREVRDAKATGVSVTTRVAFGPPVKVILETARNHDADLIVAGAFGRTGAAFRLLGSVTEQLVRTALCPVLVTRDQVPDIARRQVHSVLIATDLSEASKDVLLPAYRLLGPGGGRVALCTVHVLGALGGIAEIPVEPPLHEEQRLLLESQLRAMIPPPAAAPNVATGVIVLEGQVAADTILATAERLDADVIAMGSHGRSGLTRLFLGSVAEEVLRRSTRPVLIARRIPAQPS